MTTNLRAQQRLMTDRAIREAALALATEHGVASITVADICAQVGISQRTFFNYFRTKEECLLLQLPELRPEAVRAFVDQDEPDLLDALRSLLISHLLDMHERVSPEVFEQVMRLVRLDAGLLTDMLGAFESFEGSIAGLVARRTGRSTPDLFCRLAALVATGAVRSALMQARYERSTGDQAPGPGEQAGSREPAGVACADRVGPPDQAAVSAAFDVLRLLLVADAER